MSGTMPFDSLQVADIGDVPIVPYNIQRSCDIITDYYNNILKADCTPLTMGGDHTLTYPILRAIKEKYGAVGLIQVDAHLDLEQEMMGEPIAHGTPFRRALDEELIDPTKMFQIGLRGSLYVEEEIQEEFVEPQKLVSLFIVDSWQNGAVINYCMCNHIHMDTLISRAFVWFWRRTAGTGHLNPSWPRYDKNWETLPSISALISMALTLLAVLAQVRVY